MVFEGRSRLDGRVCVITGGLGMLGQQFAKALAMAGASVALIDIKDALAIHSELKRMVDSGYMIKTYKCDIVNSEGIAGVFKNIYSDLGCVSVLINNAGLDSHPHASSNSNGPFEEYSEDIWDAVIDSHLKGAFIVSRQFFRSFLASKQDSGSIINISTYGMVSPDQSIYEYRRRRGDKFYKPVAYTVAKSGMIGFTKWLAGYGGQFGVRVNALVPGGVLANQGLDSEFIEQYDKRTMLKRMASIEEYNEAVLFLASNSSSYMTGSSLVIDGGWTAM